MNEVPLFEALVLLVEQNPIWNHLDHIVVDGVTTHARSFHGGSVDEPVDTYSLTKPIVTTLVGCTIADGHLDGVDTRVADILPAAHRHHPHLAVRHLLTMTAAIDGDGFADIDRVMALRSSWIGEILSLPARAPGDHFKYDNRVAHLTSAVLKEVLPLPLPRYAETRLLAPLGVSRWTWPCDPEGIPFGFGHLQLSPLDLASFGRLWMAPANHEPTALIPERFKSAAWAPSSPGGAPEHKPYGFTWWCDVQAEPQAWFAAGYAGQLLAVLPSSETVVVVVGSESRLKGDELPSYELVRQALRISGR